MGVDELEQILVIFNNKLFDICPKSVKSALSFLEEYKKDPEKIKNKLLISLGNSIHDLLELQKFNFEYFEKEKLDGLIASLVKQIEEFEKRLEFEEEKKNLLKKKIYVSCVDCKLTVEEISKIVKGEIPLVYYHGTPLDSVDIILENKCLIPLKRLEYLRKIQEVEGRERKNILEEYKLEYKRDTSFFKYLVNLKEESERKEKELPEKLGLGYMPVVIEKKYAFIRGSAFSEIATHYFEQMKNLIKEKLELKYDNEDTAFIDKRLRDLKDKIKTHILVRYCDKYNINTTNLSDEEYFSLTKTKEFQKYLDMIYELVIAKCVIRVLEEARATPSGLSRSKTAHYKQKLNIFGIRDKWYVFFGANPPFRARENFWSCCGYGTPIGTLGVSVGIIFEFKPILNNLIEWEEIQPIETTPMDKGAMPAAASNKMSYDLITKKRVDFKSLLRVYTTKEQLETVKEKLEQHNIKVPLDICDNQHDNFLSMMAEMKNILKGYNLI